MRKIEELIKNVKDDMAYYGKTIDMRSMNDIPVNGMPEKYKECERLLEILDAERDGRCVVLPCKPNERWIGEQGEIVVIKIVTDWTGTYVHYRYKGKREVCCCNPTYFAIHFTREEAEAALQKEAQHE